MLKKHSSIVMKYNYSNIFHLGPNTQTTFTSDPELLQI